MQIEFYDKISGEVVFSGHNYYYVVTDNGDVLQIGDIHILTPCGVEWRVIEEVKPVEPKKVKPVEPKKVKPVEPKKVMMQMWRHINKLYDVSYPVGFDKDLSMQSKWSEKIGEPYEFAYPEEVK